MTRRGYSPWLAALAVVLLGVPAFTQDKGTPPAAPPAAAPPPPGSPTLPAPAAAPAPTAVVATVNGQPIMEVAVQRALKRVPPAKQAEVRVEVMKFLIDNALVDQYLTQLKVVVDPKDVEAKLKQVREEIQKGGGTFEKMMQELQLTEAELRTQITAQLRWEKFATEQANDKALQDLFAAKRSMFDGTMLRARHILLTPPSGDAKAAAEAQARLAGFKKQVEDAAAQGMAKLPAQTDNLEREKVRRKAMDDTFAALASKESACPSKSQGGDLEWFPYANMVEPFAKAAFALKPYQMSDVVATQFGYHLIMVTDRRDGKEPKYEEVKDDVKEVYCDQVRDAVLAKARPASKIVVTPAAKP